MQLSEQTLFRFYVGQKYHQTIRGKNCNVEEIIATEEDCKVAIASLELSWMFASRWPNQPAGCFYRGTKGFYNQITNPLLTKIWDKSDDLGGVCKVLGIRNSFINQLNI